MSSLVANIVLLLSVLTNMSRFILATCWVDRTVIDNLKELRCFLWSKGDGAHGCHLLIGK